MIAKLFMAICRFSPYLRRLIWRNWYQLLAKQYRRKDWSFMNYGYAALDPNTEELPLEEADEPNRHFIQLYHHVVKVVNLKDSNVLEVSCGRGGGSYYIKRYLEPQIMVGLDYSKHAVSFCHKNYSVNGLSFVTGDAELLPFKDDSFDVVVNVEAAHCYGSMDAFLTQVKRVLRKGGYFLYADLYWKNIIGIPYEKLRHSGMSLIKETNITPNVFKALNLDNERKTELIQKIVHKRLLNTFQEFAGIKGSAIHKAFLTGRVTYLSFVLQKTKN